MVMKSFRAKNGWCRQLWVEELHQGNIIYKWKIFQQATFDYQRVQEIHGEKPWSYMGFIWSYMVLYAFIWFYMVLYGFIWFYMVYMVLYGFIWFDLKWWNIPLHSIVNTHGFLFPKGLPAGRRCLVLRLPDVIGPFDSTYLGRLDFCWVTWVT